MKLHALYRRPVWMQLLHLLALLCYECQLTSSTTRMRSPQVARSSPYKVATWNCAASTKKWKSFARIMLFKDIDILAVQEAGSVRNPLGRLTVVDSPDRGAVWVAGDLEDKYMETYPDVVVEYVWLFTINDLLTYDNQDNQEIEAWMRLMNINRDHAVTFRIYHYDCRHNDNGCVAQSLMFITSTRARATAVYVIPSEVANENGNQHLTFPNRPAIGLWFHTSMHFVFNIHPRPHTHDNSEISRLNESPQLVQLIYSHVEWIFDSHTWLIVGDFNRVPTDLEQRLESFRNELRDSSSFRIVKTDQPTRHPRTRGTNYISRELDYGVACSNVVAGRSFVNGLQSELYNLNNNPSDHIPVLFF